MRTKHIKLLLNVQRNGVSYLEKSSEKRAIHNYFQASVIVGESATCLRLGESLKCHQVPKTQKL